MKAQVLQSILDKKMVAILRGFEYEANFRVMESLIEVGITNFEVTLNTKDALKIIEEAAKKYEKYGYVGAGTVKNAKDALEAINAGAQFLITPNLSEGSVAVAIEKNVLIAPGVFTPTEIVKAYDMGCEIVKLFPAVTLGSDYIKQIKAPLDDIKIMVVGGMGIKNIPEYFQAGADAVGIGSSLVPTNMVKEGQYDALRKHLKEFVQRIS
ncbi:MAG: bifunctional 4-hydroxy-2-oxoglutarate aldolase/2-dehydro-3-deoxy-phosphogluconate aldolase [Thermotaleaceae bacterium]